MWRTLTSGGISIDRIGLAEVLDVLGGGVPGSLNKVIKLAKGYCAGSLH